MELRFHKKKDIVKNVNDEKFAAFLFLNHSWRYFDEFMIELVQEGCKKPGDRWALCDSMMIKVISSYAGKKGNYILAEKTIQT